MEWTWEKTFYTQTIILSLNCCNLLHCKPNCCFCYILFFKSMNKNPNLEKKFTFIFACYSVIKKEEALWNWKNLLVYLSNPWFETKLLKKTHWKLIATCNNGMAIIAKEAKKMKHYSTSCASWIIECGCIACIHHARDFRCHDEL